MNDFQKMCLTNVLKNYSTVSLEQIDSVKLMDRVDRKYTLQLYAALEMLQEAQKYYSVLEVDGYRLSPYISQYYDSSDYSFYHDHHSKKANRYKIRHRFYESSNLSFFEIKCKDNKGRTTKSRVRDYNNNATVFDEKSIDFIKQKTGVDATTLSTVLGIKYNRVTLVNHNFTERVTMDFELKFNDSDTDFEYGDVVVIEIKQDKIAESPILDLLKLEKIPALGISKYCLGMITLKQNIKFNSFKPQLHLLRKFTNSSLNI
jgi:hypothetical protein